MSQEQTILKALQSGERLTVLDAINKYGCYALSQRCGSLRREGHPIKSELIKTPTGKRIAQYSWDWSKKKEPELCPLPTFDCACKGNYCRMLGREIGTKEAA